ncbi:hypothetical protein [Haloarchaeobius baliensis]|uniref:hypothetical protein n=1 Tax=Haloarchaeobius baliensis TaxID=1670458 RepID=UPI003F884BD5
MRADQSEMTDDHPRRTPTTAEQRAHRVQREAVEQACSQLAASGELTEERRQAVATLAARLRRRLVDAPFTVARGRSCHADETEVDPTVVAALFSE